MLKKIKGREVLQYDGQGVRKLREDASPSLDRNKKRCPLGDIRIEWSDELLGLRIIHLFIYLLYKPPFF